MTVQAKDASIKTATVSIRVIEVNGKQMTLSVFKQLPIKEVMYSLFGFVRYPMNTNLYGPDKHDLWGVGVTEQGELARCFLTESQCPSGYQLFIAV